MKNSANGNAHIQTTEMYVRADESEKLETLNAITPPNLRGGRFKATDKLFPVANTPEQIRDLGLDGLKHYIKTIGLYNAKAENIISWDVPGSFELVYGCKRMIETQNLDLDTVLIHVDVNGFPQLPSSLNQIPVIYMMDPHDRQHLKSFEALHDQPVLVAPLKTYTILNTLKITPNK